jgi:hypothetical protein
MPSPPKNVINNKHIGGRRRGTTIRWTNYRDGKQMRKKRKEDIKIETRKRDFQVNINA